MHVLYSFIIKYIQIAGAEIDVQTFKKPLSPKEEAYFLKLCKEGDPRARKTLIEYNMRLVAHIAKKYNGSHENDDLISAGTIGLIKAIDTYDSKKGKRLVTYASRCIENELLMLLRQNRKHAREVSLFEPIGTDKEGNEISLMDIISPILHPFLIPWYMIIIWNSFRVVCCTTLQTGNGAPVQTLRSVR